MPKVYELTGSMGGIVEDAAELVFPNVQTCVAVVAVVGSRLVGAHVTIADRRRLSQVAEAVRRRGVPTEVYVVGPMFGAHNPLGPYNVNSFANFGGNLRVHDCAAGTGIDVRVRLNRGVTFEKKPHGAADATYQAIPLASFVG